MIEGAEKSKPSGPGRRKADFCLRRADEGRAWGEALGATPASGKRRGGTAAVGGRPGGRRALPPQWAREHSPLTLGRGSAGGPLCPPFPRLRPWETRVNARALGVLACAMATLLDGPTNSTRSSARRAQDAPGV